MSSRRRLSGVLALVSATIIVAVPARAATPASSAPGIDQKIEVIQKKIDAVHEAMQKQISALQSELDKLKSQRRQPAADQVASKTAADTAAENAKAQPKEQQVAAAAPKDDTGIKLGGAIRFQYTIDSYDHANNRRKGDINFDIFRLDLHGKVHGILLDAQWRWYQYMSAMQHAWVGYDFAPQSRLQLGLTRIPFGNQPFDSHNFFFSSNYYLGLEDTYAMGASYTYAKDPWNVQLAFFKNDQGGFGGGDLTHSYSYSILGVREPGESVYAAPSRTARAVNSGALRVVHTFHPRPHLAVEVGVSALYGMLDGENATIGRYGAYALHTNINWRRWNFQVEAVHYAYRTERHATRMVVGAYAFYDTIAARANTYSLNVAYAWPLSWGPISGLTFYNDYSLVTDKSGGLANTFLDVLGVGVAAGDLYTYFDFVTAQNQPFIGGSMGTNSGIKNRFNINVGYYF